MSKHTMSEWEVRQRIEIAKLQFSYARLTEPRHAIRILEYFINEKRLSEIEVRHYYLFLEEYFAADRFRTFRIKRGNETRDDCFYSVDKMKLLFDERIEKIRNESNRKFVNNKKDAVRKSFHKLMKADLVVRARRKHELQQYPHLFKSPPKKRSTWDYTLQPVGSDADILGYEPSFVYLNEHHHPLYLTLETLRALLNPAYPSRKEQSERLATFKKENASAFEAVKDMLLRHMLLTDITKIKQNTHFLLQELGIDKENMLYLYNDKEITQHLQQRKQLLAKKRTVTIPKEKTDTEYTNLFMYKTKGDTHAKQQRKRDYRHP